MLCLTLKSGEYLTIGENVVLQYDCLSGDRCRLKVDAPREILVMRGEVSERDGKERPACIADNNKPRWHRNTIAWSRSKYEALKSMRRALAEMDGENENVQLLRRQLNHIFPPMQKLETAE